MDCTKLKEDILNCLVNFDRRILITELLDDYKLAYEQVNQVLAEFLEKDEIENKHKYQKRFLVHGMQEGEQKKEIYKIVEEADVKNWLTKLKHVDSSLYSVELSGGAKAAASIFKPMSIEKNVKITETRGSKFATENGAPKTSKATTVNKEVKKENNTDKCLKESSKKTANETTETSIKKTSKSVSSPTDRKATEKKTSAKTGINNFFAPASIATKSENIKAKTSGGDIKPSINKMENFFKKQAEKRNTCTENLKTPTSNTSVQLFDDEKEDQEVSSDEEENLEILKRDIITMDEDIADDENKPLSSSKRRRILDSDDEDEDPPVKQEKVDIKEEIKVEDEPVTETYLDEEGFVITKKPKQKASSYIKKSPTTKKSHPETIKTSPKETKKSSSSLTNKPKATKTPAVKTKQVGIMNFFNKK